jgi:Zn-dependent M32 family carboxypeptidase
MICIIRKNMMTINTFLVGFLMYDAYRHGSKYEIKKTYKATEFISENLGNEYYGDYLKNRYKKM